MCFFWDSCDQENVLEFRLNSEAILEFEICVFFWDSCDQENVLGF